MNAEADIPIEELLKKFHPELYENDGGTDDKSNNSDENNENKNSNQSDLPESADEPTPSTSSGIQRSQRRRKSQLSDNEVVTTTVSHNHKN